MKTQFDSREPRAREGEGLLTEQVGHYSRWLKRVLRASRAGSAPLPMFDSSVPEPQQLLAGLIRTAFAEGPPATYLPVFGGGNARLVDAIATAHGALADQVLTTTGATSALALIYRALAKPGDHVLVERPGFDIFATLAEASGLVVDSFARPAPDFTIDADAVLAQATPRTRLIVLSDLHNPSGMLLDADTLTALIAGAAKRGIVVIVDEVYAGYADPALRPSAAFHNGDNALSVSSLTKLYGLSTLRCGWILGSAPLVERIRIVADTVEFGPSKLAHCVATEVVERPEPFRAYADDILAAARPVLERHFAAMRAEGLIAGKLPDFGCIAFPRLVGVEDTLHFAEWLASAHDVVVTPGEFFGAAGHIRIGFGRSPEMLETALSRLAAALRAYPLRAAA
jgi:aspartate/methionine/tyrosine aminotransferase